jgi:hypothetical protein
MRSRTYRRRVAVTVAVLAVLAGASSASLYAAAVKRGPSAPPHQATSARAVTHAPTVAGTASATPSQPAPVDPVDLARHLDRMRRLDVPRATEAGPRISGEATQQPDLYAAEFVRRLLTQDYGHPREELLAWVQRESTPVADPLVVGLVPPDLRNRFAVYSVTDTTDGPAPIPTKREWATLADAHATTTARIDRVIEPAAWSNAVGAGRITDPGTTARLVAATVTRHTGTAADATTEQFSVALTLNLEGPPTRADWRFVIAVTYTAIPMRGPS